MAFNAIFHIVKSREPLGGNDWGGGVLQSVLASSCDDNSCLCDSLHWIGWNGQFLVRVKRCMSVFYSGPLHCCVSKHWNNHPCFVFHSGDCQVHSSLQWRAQESICFKVYANTYRQISLCRSVMNVCTDVSFTYTPSLQDLSELCASRHRPDTEIFSQVKTVLVVCLFVCLQIAVVLSLSAS